MEVDEGMAAGPKRVASAMDEDEDGGSGSGSSALETVPAAAPTPAKKKKNASVFDEDVLRIYYKHVFPHEAMFRWLSYGNDPDKADEQPKIDKDFFARREFSFTIANDVYIRYLCFRDAADMRKLIEAKNPHKIDIGPLYTFPPKKHKMVKAADFKPVERELVFDIDLTDYDEVRLGCTPDQMWERGSWQYMAVAMKVVDAAIREDFGYKHLLWVFSGRRGVHCWVCDPAARKLEDKERKAIVDYLTVIVGNEHSASRVNLTNPLHPSLQRAMPHLEQVFEQVCLSEQGQDVLSSQARWKQVLQHLPSAELIARMDKSWAESAAKEKESESSSSSTSTSSTINKSKNTSKYRWKQLKKTVEEEIKILQKDRKRFQELGAMRKAISTILIVFTYPRLDINVSTHRNHLLKSPFVVHPKTGKVCVPIFDVAKAHLFDPDGVPTLQSLKKELDDAPADADKATLVKHTAMQGFVDGFEARLLQPLYREIRASWADKTAW